jgi:hypothetical protein
MSHVPNDALARVDKRVKEILARRQTALAHARRAARRLISRPADESSTPAAANADSDTADIAAERPAPAAPTD